MVMKHEGGQVLIEEVLEVVPTLFEASRSSGKRGKRDVPVENVARETLTW
jgi:hypothetical protein